MSPKKHICLKTFSLIEFTLIVLLFTAHLVIPAHAETPGLINPQGPDTTTSIKELVESALRNNPEIAVSSRAIEARQAVLMIRGSYPEPVFGFTHLFENVETRLGPQQNIFKITQQIPFPGKLKLRKEVASKELQAVETELKLKESKVIRDIKANYYKLLAVVASRKILKDEIKIIEKLAGVIETRLKSGKASLGELSMLRIEKMKLEERFLDLKQKEISLSTAINYLAGRNPAERIIPDPAELEIDYDAYLSPPMKDLLLHPAVKVEKLRLEAGKKAVLLRRKDYLPDLAVGISYIDIGKAPYDIPDSGKDAWGVSLSLKIPIWKGGIKGEIARSRAMERLQESRAESIESGLRAHLIEELSNYQNTLEKISYYEDVMIPAAEEAMSTVESGYISGSVEFEKLLDVERTLLELRLKYTTEKSRLAGIKAGLDFLLSTETAY